MIFAKRASPTKACSIRTHRSRCIETGSASQLGLSELTGARGYRGDSRMLYHASRYLRVANRSVIYLCHSTEGVPQPEHRQPNQERPNGARPSSSPPPARRSRRLREDITDAPALIPPARCCLLIARSRFGGHRQEDPGAELWRKPWTWNKSTEDVTTSSRVKQPRCL